MIGWIEILVGAAIVAGTLASVVSTIVLPRSSPRSAAEQEYLAQQRDPEESQGAGRRPPIASSRIASAVWHFSRFVFARADSAACGMLRVSGRLRGVPVRPEDINARRHRVLGTLGPASLLLLFLFWLGAIWIGYGLILTPIRGQFGAALRLSASSLTTLGFAAPRGAASSAVVSLEGFTGIVAVALEISFLFFLNGYYNAREQLMRVLAGRAGHPALGYVLLWRETDIRALDTLGPFFSDWEVWAAEVTEAHLAYPWLLLFRSSDAMQSWVVSLLAMLDSAALYHSLLPEGKFRPEAGHLLRMGFTAFRETGLVLGIDVKLDPHPEDPIQLPKYEFTRAVNELVAKGFPASRTAEEAWPHFKGWRVTYEAVAYALVAELAAVPAEWTGTVPIRTRLVPHRKPASAPSHRP